ncbi:glycerophosphoryl diester phosphodiesterase membrane domain-containing protein [Ornithinimicrobium sediminis]|uniref:glycerophosphoryl diester phosphodiesterase membrane domain-containing protein n=1 Tax=Ornithinimicrobium sediminis TaxID=2904603 RepID=UPI001E569EBA|nr:glycerophosphoryl diester phosphodiesterase membrane domain-containing protein [Ornithinimicrobium sediminis]MCE0486428.1 glycerophosphoryl diester phosphodiesterase membrane domain-containing protein [Ornithinimicrobium sediminis]
MHRPGVIPLRPLTLGDIFGGALSTMRRNPEATLGMSVVVMGVVLLPSLLISLGLGALTRLSPEDISLVGIFLPSLLSIFATLALSGFIIYVVSEAALGDKVGLGQTWAAVRGRIPALVGVTLLATLALLVIAGVVLAPTLVLAAAVGEVAGVLLVVLGMVALVVLMVWVGVRLALASAPVVLERTGPLRGIGRSWSLTSGGQFWRVLGILLLSQLLASIFASVVATPVQLLFTGLTATATDDLAVMSTGLVVVQHLVQFVTSVIVTPFTAGVTALLYLDQRIRREGLDLRMQQAALQRAGTRTPR